MAHEPTQPRGRSAERAVETVGLGVLLIVIGLRPLIDESYNLAGVGITSALAGVTDAIPLHTLLIDLAILAGVFAWSVGHGLHRGRRYRWCGLELGLALVVVAVVISCLAADNKRTAINASVDWIAMALIAVALSQLLREPRQVRLALCVVIASGAAQAYQCFEQALVGFAETERMYFEDREAIWEAQGVPLDSPQVELFESRMKAREAHGYLSHSNVAGAYLLLTFFAALGEVARRWRQTAPVVEWYPLIRMMVVVLFILAAMLLTHSVGAASACAAGLLLWALRHVARKWIDARRTTALMLGWGLVVGGGLAVVAHGVHHGSLPGTSLDFRWGYWTASVELIADHPWTGVGRENFGDAYLKYKAITSPEEVKDPHNFLVSAAADWGLIGLAGVLAMVIGGSIMVTRSSPQRHREHGDVKPAAAPLGFSRMWAVLLALGIFWPRAYLLGSTDVHFLFVRTVEPTIVWVMVFVFWDFRPASGEGRCRIGWTWPTVPLACGLFAFLLQDTINFALTVPGTATTFFALVGVAIAARRVSDPCPTSTAPGRPDHRRWFLAGVVGAALVALVVLVVAPVWRASRLVVDARADRATVVSGPVDRHPANLLYVAAARADPLDPTPAVERADWLWAVAGTVAEGVPTLRAALASIDDAIARSPANHVFHWRRSGISLSLAKLTNESGDRARALESARRAIELYPSRPTSHARLGDCLWRCGLAEERRDWVEQAVLSYHHALDLDDRRPAWERIRRFSPTAREALGKAVGEAQAWLGQRLD